MWPIFWLTGPISSKSDSPWPLSQQGLDAGAQHDAVREINESKKGTSNMEKMKPATVLMTYFGKKEGQSTSEFFAEIKALTVEDKKSLVNEAAAQLGVEADWS